MKKILLIILTFSPLLCMAIRPKAAYIATPDKYGMKFEEYRIKEKDAELNSWLLTPTVNRKNEAILISTTDFGNMSYFLFMANKLYMKGYDIILYDYRGFGKSTPYAVDSDQLFYTAFATDLSNVYSFYKRKLSRKENINFLSYSMGTIVTTLFLSGLKEHIPGKVIYEGFVESLSEISVNLKKLKNVNIILPITDKEYQKSVKKLSERKLLLFVGLKDGICKIDTASAFIKKEKKWKIVTYNGEHMHGFVTLTKTTVGDIYFSDIDTFLQDGN